MTDSPNTPIQLIVTDIDGTLLNSAHQLSERGLRALKAAHARGIRVALATGKAAAAGKTIIEQAGFPMYGIYVQGLLLMNEDGRVFGQQTLHPDIARQVITYADERGFSIIAYGSDRLYTRSITPMVRDYTVPYHESLPEAVGALQNILWNTPIHKLSIAGDARAITGLRWQLNTQLNGKARILQAGVAEMLEVLPPAGGKGAGLKTLLKELGIKPEHVLAIGDAENDIDMLQIAGVSVAVGNADDKTKAAAKHVVASNDEDGFAEAIERFVLPDLALSAAPTPEAQKDG
jgi:Cof subfamily protein (haloacid dehalogenase superfamily)